MEEVASLRFPPTVFQEINFISNIYTTREKLLAKLAENEYRHYRDVEIPKVECFLYTPKAFPQTREEAARFNFSKYRGSCLTLGVCIGGLTSHNGWDEKVQLGIQGLFQRGSNLHTADQSAVPIFQTLENFIDDFPELSRNNITLEVHVCGYSLGGLFGQVALILLQDWAATTRSKIQCRTYESCGLPKFYHELARNYTEGDPDYWKRRVENYKSLPNPQNSVLADLGRVFHLLNIDSIISDSAWAWKCFCGSAKRVICYSTSALGVFTEIAGLTWAAMTAKQVVAAVASCMAAEFGLDVAEINKTHDINLMITCFEDNGDMKQGVCREMRRWTIYDDFEKTVLKAIGDVVRGLAPFNKSNAGLHTWAFWGGKKGFIERKLASFPGYHPLED